VRDTLIAAFGGEAEADLVAALAARRQCLAAFVAVAGGAIVGHVALSAVEVEAAEKARVVAALAPLGVRPQYHRRGIGARLVEAALRSMRQAGASGALVLGNPRYYGRFGFVPAANFGLRAPFDAPAGSFQATELVPGGLAGCAGLCRYAAPFDAF
jgi:putative acetyltransferase